MKKTLCCLLALLLLFSSALADTLITGEVVEIPNPGDVRAVLGEQAFEAFFNGQALFGSRQDDGTVLIGTREKALRIGALPDAALLKGFGSQLDQSPAYESSVYSSLFTHAQQIRLTAGEVGRLLLNVLNVCPLLDADGSLRQAAEAAQGDEIWATVTRYTAADQSQYPDALTLQVNVFAPTLPAIWFDYHRTDTTGENFILAVTREPVIDWDETLVAISEADPGDTSRGRMIRGFTMLDESWDYVEFDLMGFPAAYSWHVEADIFPDIQDANVWEASVAVTSRVDKTPVATVTLRSEATDQSPVVELDAAQIIDGTDGLDAAECDVLGIAPWRLD